MTWRMSWQRMVEGSERTERMKSYISAEDYYAGDGSRLIIEVESDLTGYELLDAVREAAKAFLSSGHPEAEKALSAGCGCFNWGDLALWLPCGYAARFGFKIMDTHVTDLIVPHDESLLP